MEYVTLAVLIALFVITWIVIACNAPSTPSTIQFPERSWSSKSFSEMRLEESVDRLSRENAMLRSEIEYIKNSCRNHHQPPFSGCPNCCPATRVYYAKSINEQKVIDLFSKGMKPLEDLKKELGIK